MHLKFMHSVGGTPAPAMTGGDADSRQFPTAHVVACTAANVRETGISI
jgi:hypothetical protein